jgi:hypothetical protein
MLLSVKLVLVNPCIPLRGLLVLMVEGFTSILLSLLRFLGCLLSSTFPKMLPSRGVMVPREMTPMYILGSDF